MSMVPTDVPMTSGLCERVILKLTQDYPAVTSRVITSTVFGRPVQAVKLGQGERQVLYTAAHHANEWITATVLLKFIEALAQAAAQGGRLFGVEAQTILKAATIHLVPMVNPDGVDLVTGAIPAGSPEYENAQTIAEDFPQIPFPDGWKANLVGVDLNLQYPAGWLEARQIKFAQGYNRPAPRDFVGRSPLSQREPFALAQLARELKPDLMLAYHTQGKEIYWQFQDYEVPGARAYALEFARLSGYALNEPAYISSFAGFKDWFIQRFRRPGFTIEAGQGENPLPLSQFDEIYRDNLGILVTGALGLREAP